MFQFAGLSVGANSIHLSIVHILLVLVFLIAPLAEETWLERWHGEQCLAHKRGISRFL